jgi:glycosyltransferase involved in cell wall biosynthesis
MQDPKISVLLPVYNSSATINLCLKSLLDQSLKDFEILAVDDGSTDESLNILQKYSKSDSRVKVFVQKHQGLVRALNHGLNQARGRHIARMDADDYCHPDRLAQQEEFLTENPDYDLVACRVDFPRQKSNRGYAHYVQWTNSLLSHEDIALHRFVESPFAHPSVMLRSSLFEKYGGYREGDFPEDYELWLRLLHHKVRMSKLPQPLLFWNDLPSRLSRKDSRYSIEAFYRIKAQYLSLWLQENNPFHPQVVIWGSGRTTRKRVELLTDFDLEISAYVDIDPRKIGKKIGHKPVLAPQELPSPGQCFVLSYVASRGARDDIRNRLEQLGYTLGQNFLLAA